MNMRVLVVGLFLAAAVPALSQQPVVDPAAVAIGHRHDGNWLLSKCQANPKSTFYQEQFYYDAMDSMACIGYIEGAVDVDSVARFYKPDSPQVCGGSATTGQIRDVVVQALMRHPEIRHYSAGFLVVSFLQEAFPCAK